MTFNVKTSHFLPQIQVGDEKGHSRRVIEEIKFIFKAFWAIVKTHQMSTPNSLFGNKFNKNDLSQIIALQFLLIFI